MRGGNGSQVGIDCSTFAIIYVSNISRIIVMRSRRGIEGFWLGYCNKLYNGVIFILYFAEIVIIFLLK